MPSAAQIIETKVKAFASALTSAIDKARKDALKAWAKEKKKDEKAADAAFVTVAFEMERTKATLGRTPEEQAMEVAEGQSWTCASAHMVDKARHVVMKVAPAGGKPAKVTWTLGDGFGPKEPKFWTEAQFKAEWGKQMKSQTLKNANGGDGYFAGDGFHLELDDSKLVRADPAVKACMAEYARLTRIEGMKPNARFETDWGADLKPYLDAAEKEARLKNLFEGTVRGTANLVRKGAGKPSGSASGLAEIVAPKTVDGGRESVKKVSARAEATWDSLGRDALEAIGLAPESVSDITATCTVSYEAVSYEKLDQVGIRNLTLSVAADLGSLPARMTTLDATATWQVAIRKSDAEVKGTVTFELLLDGLFSDTAITVGFELAGDRATGRVK